MVLKFLKFIILLFFSFFSLTAQEMGVQFTGKEKDEINKKSSSYQFTPHVGGFWLVGYENIGAGAGLGYSITPKNLQYSFQYSGMAEFVIFSEPYIIHEFSVMAGKTKILYKDIAWNYNGGISLLYGRTGAPPGAKDFLRILDPGIAGSTGFQYYLSPYVAAGIDLHANLNYRYSLIFPSVYLAFGRLRD